MVEGPHFERPPVEEVALSVQFDAPKGLSLAHLGAFWSTQTATYPGIRSVEPLPTVNEIFGKGVWLPTSLQFAFSNDPDCRIQMTSHDDEWMCQLQRNRLIVNWRKRKSDYPRFEQTLIRFGAAWESWSAFLRAQDIALPVPRLWEVVYVNRIFQEKLWSSVGDWPQMLPGLWSGPFAEIAGATLKGLIGQWVWESEEPPIRLFVEPKPARIDQPSPQDAMLLSLTARGPVGKPDEKLPESTVTVQKAIENGLTSGHDFIVKVFDLITSPKAKEAWKRHAPNSN